MTVLGGATESTSRICHNHVFMMMHPPVLASAVSRRHPRLESNECMEQPARMATPLVEVHARFTVCFILLYLIFANLNSFA